MVRRRRCPAAALCRLRVAEHTLQGSWVSAAAARAPQLRLPGARAQAQSVRLMASSLHPMRDLPGPEIKPVSSALAGGFFTTEPPSEALKEHLKSSFRNKGKIKNSSCKALPYFQFLVAYLCYWRFTSHLGKWILVSIFSYNMLETGPLMNN